jgi:hypothetical protein
VRADAFDRAANPPHALRRKVNRQEHEDVPAEFMKWVWAGGRKLKGPDQSPKRRIPALSELAG